MLVNNKAEEQYQNITCNQSGQVRFDTMGGRDYRVAPMVMITEGVLNANAGPILYTKEDLSKFPGAWNHKPVVVYHPQKDGAGITACSPEMITSRGVGVIMNAHVGTVEVGEVTKTALKAEAWIEVVRAEIVDNRVVEALDNELTMEVSTGLFVEIEKVEGEFNGEPYVGVAHNFQPDHLALLPDELGACSVADGAGFIRNTAKLKKLDEKVRAHIELVVEKLIDNELSFSSKSSLIRSKLWETNEDSWVDEVYDTFFVYESNGNLYKQDYLISDGVCSFVGEAVEVERVTEFRTKDGKFIGNRKDQSMNKKQIVDGLIANTNTTWDESDREVLMAMNEETLGKVAVLPVVNAETDPEIADPPAKAKAEAKPASISEDVANTSEMSVDKYLDTQVPPALRATLKAAMNTERTLKDSIIVELLANEKCVFTAEYLKTKDVEELRNLRLLAGNSAKDEDPTITRFAYSGQGGQLPINNNDVKVSSEAPLGLPTVV